MSIPGGNLLGMARRLIRFQTVQHHRFWKNEEDGAGILTPKYYAPAPVQMSVQAVSRTMFESLGLDVQRNYKMFYTEAPLQDLKRDKTPDMLDFGGRRYSVESNTDWTLIDGWLGSVGVDEGPTPP